MQKRWATASKENGLSKPILQHTATPGNRGRRIVALEEVAGLSPGGHPPHKPEVSKINVPIGEETEKHE
jgi:hypothetical protein